MHSTVLNLYKKIGETPLERLERFRSEDPQYRDAILSYAGRLDPLACGVLIVLANEENRNKQAYLELDKEYEVDILFGIATDSYDPLGIVSTVLDVPLDADTVTEALRSFLGTYEQTYPPFSSKPVAGRPLFEHARNDNIAKITLPSRTVTVRSIELVGLRYVSKDDLEKNILERIHLVNGDFRQEKIISGWHRLFTVLEERQHPVARFKIHCSSGTYVRRIAHELGLLLSSAALALSITRTRVGEYYITDSFR